ncbi:MAG: mechanosensitive ion channel family protein [Steroidobacteraceae bacterium]
MKRSQYYWLVFTAVLLSVSTVVASEQSQVETRTTDDWWQTVSGWLDAQLFSMGGIPLTAGALLRLAVIVTAAWWLSNLGQSALSRIAIYRPNLSQSSLYTVKRLLHYVVLTVGFLIGLSSIGIDLSKFALFASALGVGVGFGMQNLISNFVAGLMLLFEKTLKVGDFIELQSGITGEVREIRIRSTLITTNDNIDVVVPNSEFVNGHVMNWTMRDVNRRIRVPFGVAYGSDIVLVRTAVLEAAATVPHTLSGGEDRLPQVWLTEFADSSLNFQLIVWLTSDAVKRPSAVQADYLWAIQLVLKKYNLEIPFPQRDLHIRSWSPEARPPA